MIIDKGALDKVLGCLMRNPQLILSEEYPLVVDDFGHKHYKMLYSAVYNLFVLGSTSITPTDVEAYINQHPTIAKTYRENNLVAILNNSYNNSDLENYSFYYFIAKKYALLSDLEKNGIDVSLIYDPQLPEKEFAAQLARFNSMSIKDVLGIFNTKLAQLSDKYENFIEKTFIKAGDGVDELLNSLQEQPEVGLPMLGDIMNTVTRGARTKKLYIDSGASGSGKAIPNSTIVPTPTGPKSVGEIKVGDYLFDRQGCPTKVLGVFPQGKKRVYKVIFGDNREALCNDEHLWSVFLNGDETKLLTLSLREMINSGLRDRTWDCKYAVPHNGPVRFSTKEQEFSPYAVGLLLGEILKKGASDKVIPDDYLYGDVLQREFFFQGVLDGMDLLLVDELRVSTKWWGSKLIEQFIFLTRSLGILAFTASVLEDNELIIKYPEKKNMCIISAQEMGYDEDMTCFWVENEEKLFLMNDFIVTHNTRRLAGNAVNLAIPQYYDTEEERWINTNLSEKVLFITTELEHAELQTLFLAYLSGVDEAKILDNSYDSKDEHKRVKYAASLLKQYPNLYIEYLPEPSIESVASKIRLHALQDDIKYVFYDYIHVSASTYQNKKDMRDDVWLMLFANKLKQLANEFGLHVSTATQLNGDWEEKEVKNQNLIRGSRRKSPNTILPLINGVA
jgi:replicative DNA helicase